MSTVDISGQCPLTSGSCQLENGGKARIDGELGNDNERKQTTAVSNVDVINVITHWSDVCTRSLSSVPILESLYGTHLHKQSNNAGGGNPN